VDSSFHGSIPTCTYIRRPKAKTHTIWSWIHVCTYPIQNSKCRSLQRGCDFEACSLEWVSIPVPYFKQWAHSISTPTPPLLCSILVFELLKFAHLYCVLTADVSLDLCRAQAYEPWPQAFTDLFASCWAREVYEHVDPLPLVRTSTSMAT
jgi:hypothetical protein